MHIPLAHLCPRLAFLALLALGLMSHAAAPPLDLPAQASAILDRHCGNCHGQKQARGGLGHITDLSRLISRGQIVPGRVQDSPLFRRVHDGEMPPPGKGKTLSGQDRDLLRTWIAAGAPTGAPALQRIVREVDLQQRAIADLRAQPPRQRRFLRYLGLANLAAHPAERLALRHAIAKLVNSLSWHARLTPPESIGADDLLLRLDLRDYRWTARQWDRLTLRYPYRPLEPDAFSRTLTELTGAEQAFLRADWFVATASRPPFYHDFLQLPASDRALERQLQVDVPLNLEEGSAARAGFNGSGVARANRVLERHDAAHGAYWRSYDFSDNTSRQNIFEFPLGPMPGPAGFKHAGGELIFHLPNGLQAYLLVDADGRRIDRAPAEIVSDPKRPDRIVENGLSCLGCHVQGILPRDDQVRAHITRNPRAFSGSDRDTLLDLYVPADRLRRLVQQDNERFAAALKKLGLPAGEPEPIIQAVLRYEEVLDLSRAAAEFGVGVTGLAETLRSSELARTLGPLLARGTIQRQVFEEAFARLLPPGGSVSTSTNLSSTGPFVGHRQPVHILIWSPDGRSFVSASSEEIRLWHLTDPAGRSIGQHGEVRALALSPDGKRLFSAGADRLILIWDVARGVRLSRLAGHTSTIRALAVTPDGKQLISAGEDRTLRLWNIMDGKAVRAWSAHAGTITSLALSADGRTLASGSSDRSVKLWDVNSGELRARFDNQAEVQALALSADGRRLSAGGEARVKVWDVEQGRLLHEFTAPAGTIRSLVFRADALELFSACDPRQGQIVHGHDLRTGRTRHLAGAGPIDATALAPDGRALLARDREIQLLPAIAVANENRR